MLLTESYRELFTAVATCAAGLTGLLFVAISVTPREGKSSQPAVIHHVRAASALVAFTNALGVSLFGLVPGSSGGWAALTLGAIGIFFTAASVRSIVSSPDVSTQQALGQAGLITVLFVAFGGQFACGIGLLSHDTAVFGPGFLGNTQIALLLIGIARAWELVGNRDTGILASLAVLAGLDHSPAEPAGLADHDDADGSAGQ